MKVKNMLDLSTGHMPETKPDWGEVRYVEHEHGYVVFVCSEIPAPEWLHPIMKAAAEADCVVINFDKDAEIDEDFKQYNW